MNEITSEERKQFIAFWTAQRQAIAGRLSGNTKHWFDVYAADDNVGYEFGQLRPGKMGQWDMYYILTGPQSVGGCDQNEALIASGLTAAEVANEERREHYRENGVDPDDKREIAMFERVNNMSPDELNAEIIRLEAQLANA